LKKTWLTIKNKFEALNARERWMVACALFVVIYAFINSLLISPVLVRQKTIQNELNADQTKVQELTLQINAYAHQNIVDPDTQNKQRIADLQSHLQVLESQLSGLQTTLISPNKMPELLRSLLKKNGKLKLIELKTIPTKGLLDNASKEANATTSISDAPIAPSTQNNQANKQESPVFRHGVEITVEGRYLDLLEYVSELEQMPWHVLWSNAALNTDQPAMSTWPANRLKLTVYTLSLDKAWLSI
jgi:MSHA biogenesis protein MshJ